MKAIMPTLIAIFSVSSILAILKLTNVIDWEWFVVMLPLILPLACTLLILIMSVFTKER